jgi:hypothetical protein
LNLFSTGQDLTMSGGNFDEDTFNLGASTALGIPGFAMNMQQH